MGVTILPGLLRQLMVVNRQAGEWMLLSHPGVFPLDIFGSLFCYNTASSVIMLENVSGTKLVADWISCTLIPIQH